MSAKPVTRRLGSAAVLLASALLLSVGGTSPAIAKAPLPVVLLFPATAGDITALVDLRTRLRLDGRVDVLTYDPESAAIQRVAAEASHPEWLVSAPPKDDDRLILARALGVAFYAVVSPGRTSDSTHVELVETAVSARTFDWSGTNRQFGVRAIESQVADSIAHPVAIEASSTTPANSVPPSVTVPASPVTVPASPVTVPASPVTVPASPVTVPASPVTVPATAPIIIHLPPTLAVPTIKPTPAPILVPAVKIPSPPLSLPATPQVAKAQPVTPPTVKPTLSPAPVPAIQTPAVPLKLPQTQIAQAVPVTLPTAKPPVAAVPVAAVPVAAVPVAAVPVAAVPVAAVPKPAPKIVPPAVILPMTGPQMAMLPRPKAYVPEPDTPLNTPTVLPKPSQRAPAATVRAKNEDLTAILPLMAKGDSALDGGDFVGAISYFRQAVNGAPLNITPRLKLAQAYEKGGLSDRALDEARRALEIAPDSQPVLQMLTDLDQQNGTSDGTLIRYRAMTERSPDDPAAHAGLADALWNSGDLSGAETEYKAAKVLAPAGDHIADVQLARLYATEARYDDALGALQNAGPGGYALAIKIVKNRADTLSSTLDASRDAFNGGKSTREQFYDDAKKLSAQAQALADFVAKVTPPTRYKLSHLHRMLSTNLLAQEAATLVTFIETSDSKQNASISALEKAAATEMLTAQATEEKLGLWDGKKTAE